MDLVIRGWRVVLPEGVEPASLHVAGGVIRHVGSIDDTAAGPVVDAGDAILMPGVFDSHVHVNEPGRTEWEGFATATRAAAAGGITAIADMPLNSLPVTTTLAALRSKEQAAQGTAWVDYALWGGVVPGNHGELEGMLDAGVPGFKCFLVHSGIDEFPNVTEKDLDLAMPILARRNAVLLVHAEVPGPIAEPRPSRAYAEWLRSRPHASEDQAVELMIRLAEKHRCQVHIVHLSSADALASIAAARARSVPITVETCPHYLTFEAETIPDGATQFKCAPPIREGANRERLWRGLGDGIIDLIVSDHSPCVPSLKAMDTGDYAAAWGGISSLQLALPAVWTQARARGVGIERLASWMCERPALLAGLGGRKGRIEVGYDADLVIWDPDATLTVDAAALCHKHAVTPYAGMTLHGVVERTFLRGDLVYDRGQHPAGPIGRRIP
jgi:allantoinase